MKMKFVILTASLLTMSVLANAAPTISTVLGTTGDLKSSAESTYGSSTKREEEYKEIYEIARVDISNYAITGEISRRLEVMVAGLAARDQSTQNDALRRLMELHRSEQSKLQE